ncbi:hypothetical protein [Streptomyces sp. NPDC101181]|uniref:hypothetical protein n=1 Tax=Streptomyces sp. NPDC101181 TaxID=3366125 RepID=UPI0037F720D6
MGRRWAPALVLGGLWWWAVLRLALQPEQAGLVEGAVAAGGWGLSLLPVHVASVVQGGPPGRREGAGYADGREGVGGVEGADGADGPEGAGRVGGCGDVVRAGGREGRTGSTGAAGRVVESLGRASAGSLSGVLAVLTRAWRRHRSGGGSGRS